MCRWLMYNGGNIKLSNLLTDPENSLIHQSIHSSQGAVPVNGDGFGLGWYSKLQTEPGTYKNSLPAWNNQNLISLARHIESKNFMAHVRASTIAPTADVNCHPFRYKKHLFMHNGFVGNFDDIRHELEYLIKPKYLKVRYGSTDSEAMFLLALTNGLAKDPKSAILKTTEQIFNIQNKNKVAEQFKASIAYSDGETSHAFKISTIEHQPSLYYINYHDMLKTLNLPNEDKYENSYVVLSEPLVKSDFYTYVDNYSSIKITKNKFEIEKL